MPTASSDNAGWVVELPISAPGEKTVTFKTENKFVDQDARVHVTVPAATITSFDTAQNTALLNMGTVQENGSYYPSTAVSGDVTVTGGYIVAGDYTVADTLAYVGRVHQSKITDGGGNDIANGDTIVPSDSEQAITISEGYNTTRTIKIGAASAGALGEITSGSATINTLNYTFDSTNTNFKVAGTGTVAAPSVNVPGYISSTSGTKNTNTATVAATVNQISIQANLSGTGTRKPVITKNSNSNIAASGTATTTRPSNGYYIAVNSAEHVGPIQATAAVTAAGYGTTVSGQYTTTPSAQLSTGALASDITYIPITTATFANSATSGTTYTDISSTAPALISGDYLYINAGYTPASKISLAKLIPDASAVESLAGTYIRVGHSAYDNEGNLIVGTIPDYDGTHTIV